MLDPDNFHEGDTPDITQAKRIAIISDINVKYTPRLEKILSRPYDDPTREMDYEEAMCEMKEEMDQRFADVTRKPVIKALEPGKKQLNKKSGKYYKSGHFNKGRGVGAPNMDLYNIGVEDVARICAREGCGEIFIQSRYQKKYCSPGCEERAKRDRYIEKRKPKN